MPIKTCGSTSRIVLPVILALALPVAVRAGDADQTPAQFMQQEQARAAAQAGVHHAAPRFNRPQLHRATEERRPAPRQVVERHAAPRALVTASMPPSPAATRVAVYGDRFAEALAGGLEDEAGLNVTVTPVTSEDAGLARADFDSWLSGLRERLKAPRQAAVAVMLLGSNDRKPILDGTTSLDPASARWREVYGARVMAVAAAFREARVPLIWVGLPSVQAVEISADFVHLNAIIRDRAERQGATYVDSWDAFSDDAGRYSPMGPDLEGQAVRLRKADGFGFTRAGARKLASFVTADIKRLRRPDAAPGADVANITIERARDFDQALQIDVNAQIRREAGLAPAGTSVRTDAVPAGPVSGPVIPLTAPPHSADGQLATVTSPDTLQAALMARPVDAALPSAGPKPGRADDFSWPRP